ncbi:DUF4870 domain-containing protein [Fictibacillus enclensis]|uniref:DUF4870 domain-containing protein n=1 Tax=Fictibacillus enclensis TaxID=1017270 RepID=A0A0V8JEW4_9BACL|nr:DUF4870 domain-containing protein [Fictibacillus enclensis]KSU85497.1 hypothetical protein AS030_08365 [Fictibacillus enclensis]MDM5199423.1 DUF4870 domain-containing protein [Fictibacillus enclensis]SCB97798.1 hypothetical protein GA0061096_1758 [Fictibacillus enclensis]
MENKGLRILIHASTWFAPIVVPLIIYLLIADREVKSLALQALIFHFVIGILIGISAFLSWVLVGIPFLIIFVLMAIIAPIMGIVRALNDRHFQYPIVGSWVN